MRGARKEDASRFQYVTTNSKSMHFGHGVHACPGRFLAGNEIKVILFWLLRRYEIRAPEGQDERPKARSFGMEVSPDMAAKLQFRRRRDAPVL
jgi:cytochrome P450